jgi:hypothetical protein
MGSTQSCFENQDQKAFIGADADSSGKVCVSADQSFLVLFLEKGLLAFYESRSRPIGIIPGCPEADSSTERKHFFLEKEAKTSGHLAYASR